MSYIKVTSCQVLNYYYTLLSVLTKTLKTGSLIFCLNGTDRTYIGTLLQHYPYPHPSL